MLLSPRTQRALALFALGAGLSAGAAAQGTYRCNDNGRTVISDRPCLNRGSGFGALSGAPEPWRAPPAWPSQQPSVSTAPEHLHLMSATCAGLNDAVRTAPSRGVRGQTLADLRTDYRRRCADDEREAQQALHQEQSAQRQQRQEQRDSQRAAVQQSAREREHCAEMLRILHGKRQRSLSAGEQADLQRFEANYQARCKLGP